MKTIALNIIFVLLSFNATSQELNQLTVKDSLLKADKANVFLLSDDHSYKFDIEEEILRLMFYDNNLVRFTWSGDSDIMIDEIIGTFKRANDTIWIIPERVNGNQIFPKYTLKEYKTYSNSNNWIQINFLDENNIELNINYGYSYKYKRKIFWSKEQLKWWNESKPIKGSEEIKITKYWGYLSSGIKSPFNRQTPNIPTTLNLMNQNFMDLIFWERGTFLLLENKNLGYYRWNPDLKKYIRLSELQYVHRKSER